MSTTESRLSGVPLSRRSQQVRWLRVILFTSNGIATMAAIMVATVNPLVAAGISGAAAAGFPSAATLLGQASSAVVWGRVTHSRGWRSGLTAGLLLGGLGLALAAYGVLHASMPTFLVGLFFAGTAFSVVTLSRFAAGEIVPTQLRARSISFVVLGGTLGAVFGPILVTPIARWSTSTFGSELAGPYIGASLLLLLGAGVILGGLRPDPRQISGDGQPESAAAGQVGIRLATVFGRPSVRLGTLSMVVGQLVMVMLMVITSLHMRDHGHVLGGIVAVISAHTVGMFAFSAVSGRLADRWGRVPVILAGSATLLAAAVFAPISSRLMPLSVSLFLLGFGWNLCFVGGSALFSDGVLPVERGRAQGVNDLLVNGASAVGSLAGGLIFAVAGFLTIALLGAALALVPLMLALRLRVPAATSPAVHRL